MLAVSGNGLHVVLVALDSTRKYDTILNDIAGSRSMGIATSRSIRCLIRPPFSLSALSCQ